MTTGTPVFKLQRQLFEDSEKRTRFNQEWRTLKNELLENGLNLNDAILMAIHTIRDKWLETYD